MLLEFFFLRWTTNRFYLKHLCKFVFVVVFYLMLILQIVLLSPLNNYTFRLYVILNLKKLWDNRETVWIGVMVSVLAVHHEGSGSIPGPTWRIGLIFFNFTFFFFSLSLIPFSSFHKCFFVQQKLFFPYKFL